MLQVTTLKAEDLKGLSKGAVTEIAAALLAQLATQSTQLSAQQAAITAKDEHIARRDREIKFKDAKIERITFELARLKAWKFGARTEAMDAAQRQMFEETLAEDEADLEAQLKALQGDVEAQSEQPPAAKRKPRRQALPEHLRRVEHHHEPENTLCPTPDCGQAMVRASARTSASGWTSCRPSSSCTGTSAASGRAGAASVWCKSRWPRRSSTRACPRQA